MKMPKGWNALSMDMLGEIQAGRQRNPNITEGEMRPYLRVANVQDGWIDFSDINRMAFSLRELPIYELRSDDILLAEGQSLALVGRPAVYRGELPGCCFQNTLVRLRPAGQNPSFCYYVCYWQFVNGVFRRIAKQTTSIAHLGVSRFAEVVALIPPLPEQQKIADILGTWDAALEKLDALIAAKERRKKALMQQLLTGQRRLPGFDESKGRTIKNRHGNCPSDWSRVKLGDVTIESSVRADTISGGVVLSCTKHHGLVPSEEYFGKRVYAADTSSYKVARRGEFAYATNHIEEGSIGFQNLCDVGLVSPIYTVFKTKEVVDDAYFYRLLKSSLMIHLYRVNTSASVDRRGSLRYGEFAEIKINLPTKPEQGAIAAVLDTADAELRLLRTKREALDQQKRGLMQKLLTGKVRVSA